MVSFFNKNKAKKAVTSALFTIVSAFAIKFSAEALNILESNNAFFDIAVLLAVAEAAFRQSLKDFFQYVIFSFTNDSQKNNRSDT
jgi:hypothetical protein